MGGAVQRACWFRGETTKFGFKGAISDFLNVYNGQTTSLKKIAYNCDRVTS